VIIFFFRECHIVSFRNHSGIEANGMCELCLPISNCCSKCCVLHWTLFDDTDNREKASKGSFFNWIYFAANIGGLLSVTILVWTEENVGWGLGYGISALFIGIRIIIFFLGTPIYRFQRPTGSSLTRICQVISAALFKWKLKVPRDNCILFEIGVTNSSIEGSSRLEHTDGLRLSHSFKHLFISSYFLCSS
jgi:hypothetical protein